MKTKISFIFIALALTFAGINHTVAQGTAFTYQGRLNANGTVASGLYDFRFRLAADNQGNTYVGSSFLTNSIAVTNGLFITTIDFGAGIFTGSNYWLEVDVRTNGAAGYTALSPLQTVTPVPYALFAETASNVSGTVASASVAGTYGNAVNFNSAGNSFSGAFTGNGTSISNVNAAALNGLSASNFWQLSGNAGTKAGVNYLGTSDNQPVEIRANGLRALRLEPGGASSLLGTSALTGAPNVIGGSPVNFITAGTVGAVIGGGGATNWQALAYTNSIGSNCDFSIIAGGIDNTIQMTAYLSVIGGGYGNFIQTNSYGSVISGGADNTIQIDALDATISGGGDNSIGGDFNSVGSSAIGGGSQNAIEIDAAASVIGGGSGNVISGDSGDGGSSVIGGGYYNTIQTNALASVIGGGELNIIAGDSGDYGNSVIAGGEENTIEKNANYSVISGGSGNTIYGDGGDSGSSVIAGGASNLINTNSDHATISGGWYNTISNNDYEGVIGGGYENSMGGYSGYSTIVGGQYNTIGTNSGSSTIAGGYNNIINNNAENSLAAGSSTKIANSGSFVWGDGSATTASAANNSVTFRASGGYRFFSGSSAGGASLAAGATSWTAISDRNAKKNFAAVDTLAVLEKLAAIPIQQWNYKWEKDSDVPNIGPMAQDFKHAFYPGRDDKGISTLEFDGVELAAIQGLNQKLEQQTVESKAKDAEIEVLKAKASQVDLLETRLNELEAVVQSLAVKK